MGVWSGTKVPTQRSRLAMIEAREERLADAGITSEEDQHHNLVLCAILVAACIVCYCAALACLPQHRRVSEKQLQ
jgi:hypothetical protein